MIAIHHATPRKTPVHVIASQQSIESALEHAGVSNEASEKAAAGYVWAQNKKGDRLNASTMAVVDFTQASNHKRLYIVDIQDGTLIGQYYVAHGSGSGGRYATHFSNGFNSHESSLGVFTVGNTYFGKHGLSRHMIGLEAGINDNAANRDVELHRADYVSASFIHKYQQAGHTWGCFGISPENADTIINELPTNTVLFAYATPENSDQNLS
jgi:hypothetical protein